MEVGSASDLWNQSVTLLNKQDWAWAASLFSSDAVFSSPIAHHEARLAILSFLEVMGKASPDMSVGASLVVEDRDTVVAEWIDRTSVTSATSTPDGAEIAATVRTLELAGVTVAAVRNGKFETMREYFDSAALMSQLSG
jgi:steroid delta-isomerase-like uncharacterized protein